MEYKFHPLIKYTIFAVLIFGIFRYENVIPINILLQIIGTCVFLFMILDFVLIRKHPYFMSIPDEKEENKEEEDEDEELEKKNKKKSKITEDEYEDIPIQEDVEFDIND